MKNYQADYNNRNSFPSITRGDGHGQPPNVLQDEEMHDNTWNSRRIQAWPFPDIKIPWGPIVLGVAWVGLLFVALTRSHDKTY